MQSLVQKLQAVQAELKVPKSQFNSFGKYKYRSLEDIVEAVKPLLNQVGAFLTLSDEIVCIGADLKPVLIEDQLLGGVRFYVKATARFSDGDQSIEVTASAREPDYRKGMDVSQVTGTASSYARKYACNGLFAIDDTKDADDMDNTPAERKPAAYQKPTPKPEPVAKPGHKIIDPNDPVLKAARKSTVEESFGCFQELHKDEMPEGKIFCLKYYENEVAAAWKGLTAIQKKKMVWDLESVNKLAESILSVNCLTDIKVDPMA